MPLSELLSQTYEPGDVDLMQRAFDSAWKQLGSSVHGHEKDAAVRDILGRAIVTLLKRECATKSSYGAPPFTS